MERMGGPRVNQSVGLNMRPQPFDRVQLLWHVDIAPSLPPQIACVETMASSGLKQVNAQPTDRFSLVYLPDSRRPRPCSKPRPMLSLRYSILTNQ